MFRIKQRNWSIMCFLSSTNEESFQQPKHPSCPHESASNWQLPLSDPWEEIINWFSQLHVQSSELLAKCLKFYPFWPHVPLILPSHWIPDMLGGIFAKNCLQDWSVNSLEVSFNFNATNSAFYLSITATPPTGSSFYPILFGHENILHQNAPMVIVTIKARNGWLYKRFGGHLLLMSMEGMQNGRGVDDRSNSPPCLC